ncbi:TolC family protein [Phragmitibacter flavus]|uniref:TolC family protein n=1 Tax=Phragmitibacter flavus TaxID=2576071 RepID=A0A5R8KJI5_9BACT|nr:TolC family protein [Phragmitibacter flavus]TLD72095.1 TolC family protein [Phragmitibacter flavus]
MMKNSFFYVLVSCSALTGCALKTPPGWSDILTDRAKGKIPDQWTGTTQSGPVVPNWIRGFGDPRLTKLVQQALERNPDLVAAAAKVEASQAAVRIARAALYPRVAGGAIGERHGRELSGDLGLGLDAPNLGGLGRGVETAGADTRSIDSSSQQWVYGLGIGASWEADVWGRVRNKRAAAKSDSEALAADYEFARQSLAAQTARAWFSAIEASQQAANARETLSLYDDFLKLFEVRKEQGVASDFEMAQVNTRVAGAKDVLHTAEGAREQAVRAIEVLVGEYPAGNLKTSSQFPSLPRNVPAGLPSQLLERRPDVIAAERRVAAAFHRAKEAKAARLPRFALTATGGIGSAQLDGVGALDSFMWTLGSSVTQPIFFGGELKAVEDVRKAEQRAAMAAYTGTALRAFEDVETSLTNERTLRLREGVLSEMVTASGETVRLSRDQFDTGKADMFVVLRLSGESLAAKIQLAQIRASRLRERVNLHLALGGGFSAEKSDK